MLQSDKGQAAGSDLLNFFQGCAIDGSKVWNGSYQVSMYGTFYYYEFTNCTISGDTMTGTLNVRDASGNNYYYGKVNGTRSDL